MIKLIKRATIGTRLWMAVLAAASRRDYGIALVKMEKFRDLDPPRHVEYETMYGFLLWATEDDARAMEVLQGAVALVDGSDAYNSDEQRYLKTYISYRLASIAQRSATLVPDSIALELEPGKIDLSSVRQTLSELFPLPEHPRWAVSD